VDGDRLLSDAAPPLRHGKRLLLGPGPSNVSERVLDAMRAPLLGHLDPTFLEIQDRIQEMLRFVFRSSGPIVLPVSGTGSAGMECAFANLIERGDRAVIAVMGYFGGRMVEVAERCGATVTKVEAPWGETVPNDRMIETIRAIKPKVVAFVHAETSTGVLQPVGTIAKAAHDAGALVILDCVTSLGGLPVEIDGWNIDFAYSGSQKCLGAPPGLSPISVSDRALAAVKARKTPVESFYLDVTLLSQYWAGPRMYHHTAPILLDFALYEALRALMEEGLPARFERHVSNHEALIAGIKALGLELASQEGHRLPMLNAIRVPDGVDEAAVRKHLLVRGIEIGAGLGPLKGKIWRVGLMGESSRKEHVATFLEAFEEALRS
jgi:alanine-glyoxylate transaminase / serine-glyoxylate transaminase / serine-pyruvate transaminase